MRAPVLAAVLVLFQSATALAAVWYVSPSGDDAAGLGSKAAPWKTVGHALLEVEPGDHVRLMDDGDPATKDYSENVTILPELAGLVIERDDADSSAPLWAATGGPAAVVVEADGVALVGIRFRAAKTGAGIKLEAETNGCRVQDCTVTGPDGELAQNGIVIAQKASGHALLGNHVAGTVGAAVLVYGNGHVVAGNDIEDCDAGVFWDTGGYGVLAANTIAGAKTAGISLVPNLGSHYVSVLLGNTVSGCAGIGVRLKCQGCILLGNTLSQNGASGVSLEVGGSSFAFNDLSDNAGGPISGPGSPSSWTAPVDLVWRHAGGLFKGPAGNYFGAAYGGKDDGTGGAQAGDGIGDTSLPFALGSDADAHPLVAPPAEFDLVAWLLAADGTLAPLDQAIAQPLGMSPGPELLPLASGQSLVFAAVEPATELLFFAAGGSADSTSWTWRTVLQKTEPKPASFLARMGWVDSDGDFRFGPDGPAMAMELSISADVLQGALEPAWLVIPAGGRLAFSITSQEGNASASVVPWASYVTPSVPGTPPYPESGLSSPAALEVTPPAVDLGDVLIGQAAETSMLVENSGAAPVTVGKVFAAGQHAESLDLPESGCLELGMPFTLLPGESCELSLSFYPSSGGPKFAALMLESDDPAAPILPVGVTATAGPQSNLAVVIDGADGQVLGPGISCPTDCTQKFDPDTVVILKAAPADGSVLLSWDGCDQAAGLECTVSMTSDRQVTAHFKSKAPLASVEPETIEFGEVTEGQPSLPRSVEIFNDGDGDLPLYAIEIEGPAAADFEFDDDPCSESIVPAGGSCTLQVVFAPGSGGQKEATLVIPTGDLLNPSLSVEMTGTSLSFPRVLNVFIAPPSGGTVVGEGISCPGDCTETFPGPTEVTLKATPAGDFEFVKFGGGCETDSDSCVVDLAQSRMVVAYFAVPMPVMEVAPGHLDFGLVAPGATHVLAVKVTNVGSAPLTVESAAVAGILAQEFKIDSDSCTGSALQAGGTCEVAIGFAPGEYGLRAATLVFLSNDAYRPEVRVDLVGLAGGEAVDIGEEPDVVEVAGDVLAIAGASVSSHTLSFGYTPVGGRSEPRDIIVSNTGSGEFLVDNIQIEGIPFEGAADAPGEFSVIYEDCNDKVLGPGEECVIRLVHEPEANGLRTAVYLITTSDPVAGVLEVRLLGNGGSPGGDGCSAARPGVPVGPGSRFLVPLLLLVLGACSLAALRRRRALSIGALLLLTTHILPSCGDEVLAPCYGSMNARLSDTGDYNGLVAASGVKKWVCGAESYGCGQMQFTCFEDTASWKFGESLYFSFTFDLKPPLFEGRVYGPGNSMSFQRSGDLWPTTWVIVDGGIKVVSVEVHETPEACADHITLEFDVGMGSTEGELSSWLSPPPVISRIEGTVKYSYGGRGWLTGTNEQGNVYWMGCKPPQVESASSEHEWGIVYHEPGLQLIEVLPPQVEECPPDSGECCGSDVNTVSAQDSRALKFNNSGTFDVSETLTAAFTPPEFLLGNWVCDPTQIPFKDVFACPVWHFPTGFTAALPATPLTRYGPLEKPVDAAWREAYGPFPDIEILSPSPNEKLHQGQPLRVTWEVPATGTVEKVTIELYDPDGGEASGQDMSPSAGYFKLDVPDTGEVELDPGFLLNLGGDAVLTLTRTVQTPLASACPFAEGSSATVVRSKQIPIVIDSMPAIPFPKPAESAPGWSPTEMLGEMSTDTSRLAVPRISVGPDGTVWTAWIAGGQGDGDGALAIRSRALSEVSWVDHDSADSAVLDVGEVRITTASGKAAVAACDRIDANTCAPAAVFLEPGQPTTVIPLQNVPMHPGTLPFAALFSSDGSPLLVAVDNDGKAGLADGEGVLQPLEGFPPAWQNYGIAGWLMGDGRMAFTYQSTTTMDWDYQVWIGGLGAPESAAVGSLGPWFTLYGSAREGVCDGIDSLYYAAAVEPGTGEVVHTGVLTLDSEYPGNLFEFDSPNLPFKPYLESVLRSVRHAVGPDRRFWLLLNVDCPSGICPVMFHETLTGDWQGPFIPAHVNGEADLAVDPAGTVHLLWTSPPGGDAEAPASVSYSHMEVQP